MRIPKPILERRRSIRVEEALPFKIGLEGFEAEAMSLNISSSGAMCLMEKDIPLLTKLSLAIRFPSVSKKIPQVLKSIRLKGVMVRKEKDLLSGKFKVAIFFCDLSTPARKTLERFIDSRIAR